VHALVKVGVASGGENPAVVSVTPAQERSQEFAEGTRGGLGPLAGSRGRAPVGVWGEAPRSRRHMLNIQLNKAIDRHKSRTVQSPIILWKNFQLRRGTCSHVPLATPLALSAGV